MKQWRCMWKAFDYDRIVMRAKCDMADPHRRPLVCSYCFALFAPGGPMLTLEFANETVAQFCEQCAELYLPRVRDEVRRAPGGRIDVV